MAGRVSIAALISALSLFALVVPRAVSGESSAADADPHLLVGYSFEEEDLATGPDTFAVIARAKGSVELTSDFRVSGYSAVVIRDVPDDGDFPELVGYFPVRRHGHLYAHFALLLTGLDEELNIALAGPNFFRLEKDGIAFWLSLQGRSLVHWSDSMPKRLFEPAPFTWYSVDVDLDLERGSYGLRISEEGNPAPRVELAGQPNATAQPGSAVDKFSFIGDRGTDTSSVVYYVDDIVLGTDSEVELGPFVAPGRRHMFVDSLTRFREHGGKKPVCLPAIALSDYVGDREVIDRLRSLFARDGDEASSPPANLEDLFAALQRVGATREVTAKEAWDRGCAALVAGDAEAALRELEAAVAAAPESPLYQAARALALAQARRFAEADEQVFALGAAWADDPRYPVLVARLGAARGDLAEAESWLTNASATLRQTAASPVLAQMWTGQRSRELTRALAQQFPDDWRDHVAQALLPEQYFFVLLWQERFDRARDYALAIADILEEAKLSGTFWRERAGDAAFHGAEHQRAKELYERCSKERREGSEESTRLLLKLADVHFELENLAEEKRLRETIYGSLRAAETR